MLDLFCTHVRNGIDVGLYMLKLVKGEFTIPNRNMFLFCMLCICLNKKQQ